MEMVDAASGRSGHCYAGARLDGIAHWGATRMVQRTINTLGIAPLPLAGRRCATNAAIRLGNGGVARLSGLRGTDRLGTAQ